MRAALLVIALVLAGCSPRGFLPGNALRGELVLEPVSDWSSAEAHYRLEVETLDGTWWPSATSWFFVHEGVLHLHGYTLPGLAIPWVARVRAGSTRVRIRIDGKLHDGELDVLTGPGEIEPLLPTALAKYHMVEAPRARLAGPSRRYPDTQMRSWWFRFRSSP